MLRALPFAMWFYLAIEELPLAAEEAHDPAKDMPKGILYGLLTLVATAFLTLVLNTAMPPGAEVLGKSDEPLFDGFRTIFGDGIGARVLALVAVTGLVASFHSIVFAYGRQIYSLSRAGYFPRALSVTGAKRKTPHVALIVGAVLGYAAACLIHFLGSDHPVGAVLLNMAVFGAVISQSGSYWWDPDLQDRFFVKPTSSGVLIEEVLQRDPVPVRFWMEVGEYEDVAIMVGPNRHLRDILRLKGNHVTYREFVGGHDYLHWRGSLAEALINLLAP